VIIIVGKEMTPEQPVSLWRNRDYLLLWLGQAVSSLGTGISQFAFPLLILLITHSFGDAGFAGALTQLPYLLLSLPAGALVDRWKRKRIMIMCTIGLALCLGSIPLTLLLWHLTVIQIYITSFVVGVFFVFYELAELSALTQLVAKIQISAAVAQNEAVYSSVSLLAPSLGGLLLSLGYIFPFIADVISYLILLGSLLNIRSSLHQESHEAGTPNTPHIVAEIREGIQWLWSHVIVRTLSFLSGYLYLVMSGSVLIVYAIARQHHISLLLVGAILAVGGVGNLLGTALSTPLQRSMRFGTALCLMLVLFVLLWPLYSLASSPIFLGVVVASLALVDSITAILSASYRLTVTPNELQGRVGGAFRLVLYGFLTLGQALIGQSLDHLGVLPTIGVMWCGLILFAAIVLIDRRVRGATFPA
jgi:predicted MFS family arabinose efflux permease